MISFLPVVICGALALAASPDYPRSIPPRPIGVRDATLLLHAPERRVRTTDPKIHALLEQGVRRSSTLASLVVELNTTDVIVYIEQVTHLSTALAGQLLFVNVAGGSRYLRIQIAPAGSAIDTLVTIGHELRHALEVAAEPHVRDLSEFEQLYKRIGKASVGAHGYDTFAAQLTGRHVRLELGG